MIVSGEPAPDDEDSSALSDDSSSDNVTLPPSRRRLGRGYHARPKTERLTASTPRGQFISHRSRKTAFQTVRCSSLIARDYHAVDATVTDIADLKWTPCPASYAAPPASEVSEAGPSYEVPVLHGANTQLTDAARTVDQMDDSSFGVSAYRQKYSTWPLDVQYFSVTSGHTSVRLAGHRHEESSIWDRRLPHLSSECWHHEQRRLFVAAGRAFDDESASSRRRQRCLSVAQHRSTTAAERRRPETAVHRGSRPVVTAVSRVGIALHRKRLGRQTGSDCKASFASARRTGRRFAIRSTGTRSRVVDVGCRQRDVDLRYDDAVAAAHDGDGVLELRPVWNFVMSRYGRSDPRSEAERLRRKQQKKKENRARKALRTITIILGAFVLCWTPWH